MPHQYSIAQARDQFTQIVQKAEDGEPVQITRRGQPVAVLLSHSAYQRMTLLKPYFGEALESFRDSFEIQTLDINPEQVFSVRDRTPGREVCF